MRTFPETEMRRLIGGLKLDRAPEARLRILEPLERGVQGSEVVGRHRIERVDPSDALERFDRKLGVTLELVDEPQVVMHVRIIRGELARSFERCARAVEVPLVEIGDAEVDLAGSVVGHERNVRFERLDGVGKAELLEQGHAPVRVHARPLRLAPSE